jgi:hypothetical protein
MAKITRYTRKYSLLDPIRRFLQNFAFEPAFLEVFGCWGPSRRIRPNGHKRGENCSFSESPTAPVFNVPDRLLCSPLPFGADPRNYGILVEMGGRGFKGLDDIRRYFLNGPWAACCTSLNKVRAPCHRAREKRPMWSRLPTARPCVMLRALGYMLDAHKMPGEKHKPVGPQS